MSLVGQSTDYIVNLVVFNKFDQFEFSSVNVDVVYDFLNLVRLLPSQASRGF